MNDRQLHINAIQPVQPSLPDPVKERTLSLMQRLQKAPENPGGAEWTPQPCVVGEQPVMDRLDLSADALGIADRNQEKFSYYRDLSQYYLDKQDFERRSALQALGLPDAFAVDDSPAVEDGFEPGLPY